MRGCVPGRMHHHRCGARGIAPTAASEVRTHRHGREVVKKVYLVTLLLAVPLFAGAAEASRPGHAAIASAHKLATAAGLEVLDQGGNAFDAAVAVAATLSVVEPQSSGIGGGGLFLLHRASDGKNGLIGARETAAASADAKQ